jgi:phage gp36-like protein
MAYATSADAIALYGEDFIITSFDRDNNGTLDTAAIDRMLSAATATINGYLKGRVTLPLASVPEDLVKYCVDIAVYDGCPSASVMTEQKTRRYDSAMTWLRGVRDNKIVLADASGDKQGGDHLTAGPEVIPMVGNTVEIDCGARDFTRESMRGLI